MSKVFATVNQFVGFEGQSVWLGAGDPYDSGDPLVKAFPDFFTKESTGAPVAAEEKPRTRGRSS